MKIVWLLCTIIVMYGCDKEQTFLGIYTHRGLRPTQEDRYLCETIDNGLLVGVFDGHNGNAVVDFAANNVTFFYKDSSGSFPEKMRKAFQRLDNHELIKKHQQCGSTATLVFINKDVTQACFAHIGNSRTLLEKCGAIDYVTQDHVLSNPEEFQRLKRLGGHISFYNNALRVEHFISLSRAFGDWCVKEYISADPECIEWVLTPKNRYIILATDGLWRIMNNQQVLAFINDCVKKHKDDVSPQLLSTLLGKDVIKKAKDNVTIMVVDLLLLAHGNNQKKEMSNLD